MTNTTNAAPLTGEHLQSRAARTANGDKPPAFGLAPAVRYAGTELLAVPGIGITAYRHLFVFTNRTAN